MLKRISEHLASINLTLILLVALVAVWRTGRVPCVELLSSLGIAGVASQVEQHVDVGPPLKADLEIRLEDGRTVFVLVNGGVLIRSEP